MRFVGACFQRSRSQTGRQHLNYRFDSFRFAQKRTYFAHLAKKLTQNCRRRRSTSKRCQTRRNRTARANRTGSRPRSGKAPLRLSSEMKSFDAAAKNYERHSQVQQTMADWLAEWIPCNRTGTALEIGAGTGLFTGKLLPWKGRLIASDAAPAMVSEGKRHHPKARMDCRTRRKPAGNFRQYDLLQQFSPVVEKPTDDAHPLENKIATRWQNPGRFLRRTESKRNRVRFTRNRSAAMANTGQVEIFFRIDWLSRLSNRKRTTKILSPFRTQTFPQPPRTRCRPSPKDLAGQIASRNFRI